MVAGREVDQVAVVLLRDLGVWVRCGCSSAALAFTLYRDAAQAATCFAFRNFEHVWEIGGL
ncbi:MAG: hypothetical protein ACJ8CR_25520 [Roseiflexaceae bacterium]